MNEAHRDFWHAHPGLVWSNSAASDAVHIRAALVRPQFGCLLDIAMEFGLSRLQEEWAWLLGEPTPEVRRAQPIVERILGHLEKGFARAASRD